MIETNFKYVPYRNKKILQSAKGQACQHCGKNDGTTVAAHSNLGMHGKGVGKKSDDCFVAYLCAWCHDCYDRKMEDLVRHKIVSQYDFEKAMHKTWRLLLINGVLK